MTEEQEALHAEVARLHLLVMVQRNRMTQLIKMHRAGIEHYEKLRARLELHGQTIAPLSADELPLIGWNSEQPLFDLVAEAQKVMKP